MDGQKRARAVGRIFVAGLGQLSWGPGVGDACPFTPGILPFRRSWACDFRLLERAFNIFAYFLSERCYDRGNKYSARHQQ